MSGTLGEVAGRRARVLIAVNDRDVVSRLRDAFQSRDDVQAIGVAGDSIEAAQMVVATRPDVIVVDDRFDGDGLHLCGVLSRIQPHLKVILLVQGINEETVLQAARAGAREVITQGFEPHEFLDALGRITRTELHSISRDYELAVNPESFPRVIVVTEAKGGAGATCLAANLAVCFGASESGKTVLMDCGSVFSDTRTILDVRPSRSLADLIDEWEAEGEFGLDPDVLGQCIGRVGPNVDLITSASASLCVPPATPRVISRAIRAIKRFYRYIVVDAPPDLLVGGEPAIPSFWRLYIVANLSDVTLLQNTKRLVGKLREDYGVDARVGVVVNRFTKNTQFTLKDLESAVGLTGFITIPEDSAIQQACNIGKPVVTESPKSPAARAVIQMAEGIMEAARHLGDES